MQVASWPTSAAKRAYGHARGPAGPFTGQPVARGHAKRHNIFGFKTLQDATDAVQCPLRAALGGLAIRWGPTLAVPRYRPAARNFFQGNGKRGTVMSKLVAAVGYLRRSDESQETSISDQRKAVQLYADEHSYNILRWYTDDAVSGDNTEKRFDFQRMIADAQDKGDFKAILCWDDARFGRFDSIEAGYYIFPLRKAGVYLATVMGGITDWNDSMGRMVGNMKQEGKHQQLIDHSGNVTRGQLEAVKNGSWIGSAPYAYRIKGEKKNKRLVVDDTGTVLIVRRIFHEFVVDGWSMSRSADGLNADGIPSPGGRGKPWRFDTVKVILENPAYTGDYAGGRYS